MANNISSSKREKINCYTKHKVYNMKKTSHGRRRKAPLNGKSSNTLVERKQEKVLVKSTRKIFGRQEYVNFWLW